MKIALTLEAFDPQWGETEAAAFGLARHLLQLKHDVHIVAQHFCEEGLKLPIVPHRVRASRSVLRRGAAAEAKVRPLNANIVHDMGLTWYADIFTPKSGPPEAMRERQLAAATWWSRPVKRWGYSWSSSFRQRVEFSRRQMDPGDSMAVMPSEIVAKDYSSLYGLPLDRIRVVHPGVDIKTFSPHIRKLRRETTRRKLGFDTKDMVILAIADTSQQETWPHTFRAMRRMVSQKSSVGLVVVGKDRVGSSKTLAGRYGIEGSVKWIGALADRTPYYAAADVLLAPTHYAAWSQVVLEAAACGLPSITSRQNGIADVLTHGSDSCILDRYSARELLLGMELFRDPAVRERMGQAARRTAMKHPLDRTHARILQLYEEVIESRRQAPDIVALPHWQVSSTRQRRAA